ncbi:class I adenylate-forming enzyme family protein [Microbulbifer sp. GL-2]|uniref:class I adenylate-forming enzyme family protein n=1 Tax=Microbulbifer sp. GL-2 TaxID=2591606 RepID=UPI00155AF7CD|nr:class I adenylate-forming enzyme family protein [Microbulbifer sp. GL-2]
MADILKFGLVNKADQEALVSAVKRFSWRELDEASDCLAGNYLALGLRTGDRLASLMPNRVDLVIHYLACFKAGLVATPLNYRYTAPEIDHALGVTEAAALLSHEERDGDLTESKRAGSLPLGVIRYSDDHSSSERNFATLTTATPASVPTPPDDAAPAIIFFTSGSTGKPKGVTLSRETLGWQLATQAKSYEMNADDAMMPACSISHTVGFLCTFAALATGARVAEARSLEPGSELDFIRAERPTILAILPAALLSLVRTPGAIHADFASLRICGCGGDKISPELDRDFTELTGFPISEGYGMSETGMSIFNNPSCGRKFNSLGQICSGYTGKLRDNAGREVPVGQEGRLWVKSPANMNFYWNRPDATAETIQDGWLDTGDIMYRDEDNFFWFRGRSKQIIIHDGSNISPQEVEGALMEHPAVAEAGVVGIHDLIHGENVRAYVTLVEGAEPPQESELIVFVRQQIGYKAPEEIVFLDEMPINSAGKVDRVTLKQLAAQHHAEIV